MGDAGETQLFTYWKHEEKSVRVNLRLIGKYSKDFVLLNFEVRTSLGFYEKNATLAAPLKYVGVSCKAKKLLEGMAPPGWLDSRKMKMRMLCSCSCSKSSLWCDISG